MPETEHKPIEIYVYADNCDHPEPDQSAEGEDDGYTLWDSWADEHVGSAEDGELVCMLTPMGTFCLTCTERARQERDLPSGEWVGCQLAGVPADA